MCIDDGFGKLIRLLLEPDLNLSVGASSGMCWGSARSFELEGWMFLGVNIGSMETLGFHFSFDTK